MSRADAKLGLAGESLVSAHRTNVGSQLVQRRTNEPELEALFHVEPIGAAIGLTCTFCMLWIVIVFLLYRIARLTF
jgi:hypothetical protein